MVVDQNQGKANDEPTEDGLSALKRLAALDESGAGPPSPDSSSQAPDVTESIPDWLELLLAKYGEQASELAGVKTDISISVQPSDLTDTAAESGEAFEIASLLDQMAVESESEPPADQLATSVDWGELSRLEDERAEDHPPDQLDRLDRMEEPTPPPPVPSAEEETADWLGELGKSQAELETPTEAAEASRQARDVEDMPDWLQELPSSLEPTATPEPMEPSPPETAAPGAEVPDWLEDLSADLPDVGAQPAKETQPEPEDEVPDWMKELGVTTQDVKPVEAETTPPPTEGELPDWLRDLGVAATLAKETLPARQELEAPSDVSGPEEEGEVPDWLRELEAAAEAPAAEPPSPEIAAETPAESATSVPDWLASLREDTPSPLEMMAEEETPVAEYPEGEPAEEPEWLSALRTTGEPDLLELDDELVETEEDLPDWLEQLRASQEAVKTPPPIPEAPPEMVEADELGIPEGFEPQAEIEAAIPEAEELQPAPGEVDFPGEEEVGALAWLAAIEAAAPAPEHAEGETLPAEEAEALPEPEEVPEWLRQMPPADLTTEAEAAETEKETAETRRPPEWLVAGAPPSPGEEEIDVSLAAEEVAEIEVAPPEEEALKVEEALPAAEEIAPAEIPDWLMDMKPVDAEPTELGEEELIESEDVLAGIPGLLPIVEEELEEEAEPIAALRARVGVPEVPDVEGATLFKEAVDERAEAGEEERIEAEATPEAKRGRIVERLVWALVFIILIAGIALAVLAVLNRVGDLLGGPAFREFFGSPLVIDPAPVNTFRAQITRLPPDSVVVVSFDYGPATEAEMEPLAQVILRDLLESEARVIAVSLRPEGPMMAQRLFERFDNEYPYGERILNLGYLPGQTAGVRSLAFLSSMPLFHDWRQTLDEYPAWQDVDSLEDVALIVNVADNPFAVRWWVEQMGPDTQANRPMIAAVSAAADPSVRPYYDQIDPQSGQLLGLVSGITSAAAYENRLGQPGRAVNSLAAQSVAHLGLVVVILGGTVVGFRMQATGGE